MTLFSTKSMLILAWISTLFFNPNFPISESTLVTAPNCITGLAIELQPLSPPRDVDGDHVDENGAATVHALDLIQIKSPADTAGFTFSVNREGGIARPEQDSLILTCNDPASVILEVWRWDEAQNGAFCTTYALLTDNLIAHCRDPFDPIVGQVVTEEGAGVGKVKITTLDDGTVVESRDDGLYFFAYWNYSDFSLSPQLDTLPLNGVTTFDLVVISKHILGLELLESPYKMIAADVNGSGSISIMDLIELRRLLLNIEDRFQHNTSWRFIPANFQFPDPTNPWQAEIPEVIQINSPENEGLDLDFTAIKTGDVTGDALTNAKP